MPDNEKLRRQIHDFGERELKVLDELMAEPMREHLRKRGLTHKEIDGVFREELERHVKNGR